MSVCDKTVKLPVGGVVKPGIVLHSDLDCSFRYLIISADEAEGQATFDWRTGDTLASYPCLVYDASQPIDKQSAEPTYISPWGPYHLAPGNLVEEEGE